MNIFSNMTSKYDYDIDELYNISYRNISYYSVYRNSSQRQ
jgi:hypothetical protein